MRAYQNDAGVPATGAASDVDWTAITDTPVPGLEARCLQLTSTFEGHGYTLVQGNWDNAWITWGIIGFTLKHGGIQSIVRHLRQSAPECIVQGFGDDAARFLQVMDGSAADQEAWANTISIGAKIAEPWRTHFQNFGSLPAVQAEQRARAHTDYFVPAMKTAAVLGCRSELGVALCFDIQVQNGGVSAALQQTLLNETAGQLEPAVRERIANVVADHALARFRDDVRARKLSIARGQGTVHGRTVTLANWGLSDV